MPIIGARIIKSQLVDLDSGAVEAALTLVSTSIALSPVGRCIYRDGQTIYNEYYNGTALVLDTIKPDGSTFVKQSTETPGIDFLDVCFDGVFYWFLTNTTVFQVNGPHTTDQVSASWTHGVTNPRGIMTDGNNIIIMSA